ISAVNRHPTHRQSVLIPLRAVGPPDRHRLVRRFEDPDGLGELAVSDRTSRGDVSEVPAHDRSGHVSGSISTVPSGRLIPTPHRRLVWPDGSGSALISSTW